MITAGVAVPASADELCVHGTPRLRRVDGTSIEANTPAHKARSLEAGRLAAAHL